MKFEKDIEKSIKRITIMSKLYNLIHHKYKIRWFVEYKYDIPTIFMDLYYDNEEYSTIMFILVSRVSYCSILYAFKELKENI